LLNITNNLNEKSFLSLATLATFGFVSAQIKEKGTIEITPKIGACGFEEYSENDCSDHNSGIELGTTIDYYFNNRWSLRSGLIADKMGSKNQFSGNFYKDELNYLSIPVNAN
jgi:hypothetical protein